MARMQAVAGALAALVSFLIHVPEVSAQNASCAALTARFAPKLAKGYTSAVIATGLRSPRHMVIDTAGNLLVAEGGSSSVRRLVLKENDDGTVCVTSNAVLASGTNHEVTLSGDGNTLFVSNLSSVTAYPYDAEKGTVGTAKVLINNMTFRGTHPTRALLVSKMNSDIILVARGSISNVDNAAAELSTGRAVLKMFSLGQAAPAPIDFNTGGETLGWGLRNLVGLGEDPVYGGVWSVENNIEDAKFNGKDVHNENPAEKANYHGTLNATSNPFKGANYGYPSCFPVWDPSFFGDGVQVGDLFHADNTPAATDCASRQKGRLNFPSHTAPLDIKFNANATAAYIAFHGGWNRDIPDGYRVMRIAFKNGDPVEPATSREAQIPVMENQNTLACPRSCFRPVGLAFDNKGRLYVSSDSSGEIHVIYGLEG